MEKSKKKPSLIFIIFFSHILAFIIVEIIHLISNEILTIKVSYFGIALSMIFLVFCYRVENFSTRLGMLLILLALCSVFFWMVNLFIDFSMVSWTLYFSLGLFLLVLYGGDLNESDLKTSYDSNEHYQKPLPQKDKNEQKNLEREQLLKEKIREFSDSKKDEYFDSYQKNSRNEKNNYVRKLEKQINNELPIEELPVELSNKRLDDLKWLNKTGVWNDKNKKRYIKAQITPEEIYKITGRRNTNPYQSWDGTRGFDDWASK